MILIQWLVGAFLMFLMLPLCLGAIWFGISQNWINTLMIVGGALGLLLIFWLMNKFDWK